MAITKPIHEIRLGNIRAVIWANQANGRNWFNVTVVRCFQDNQQWKEATGFRRDDLPIVAKAADLAYAWIWKQEAEAPHQNSNRRMEAP